MTKPQPKIAVIGGGTGSFTLLQHLKLVTPNITAIVNMSDDGGSTGILRDELGVLPPGDIRQCLVALSDSLEVRDLFSYRFHEGRLEGQSVGNVILSALELQYGSFPRAIQVAGDILHITGEVIPITLDSHTVIMKDGKDVIRGEHVIGNRQISDTHPTLWLEPAATINPAAAKAISQADLIVIAPGNLYGSLLPICVVDGVPEAIAATKAQVVSVTNLVTKPGQTDGWHVVDYVKRLEEYLGEGQIDTVLYNATPITDQLLKKYAADGEFPVATNADRLREISAHAVGARLVSREISAQDPHDTLIRRTLIRHDAKRVSQELLKLLG